jgi:hypothetical protein
VNPKIGFLLPVREAFSLWLGDFYTGEFQPDTKANEEWRTRGLAKAIAWCPSRMVDSIESMLSSWRTNDNLTPLEDCKPPTSAYIPVMLLAMSAEYIETPAEAGRTLTDRLPVNIPGDTLNRCFAVSLLQFDLRMQVAVVTTEPITAQSMLAQVALYAKQRSKITARFEFAGLTTNWPTEILMTDRFAQPVPIGEHITAMTMDLTLRATVPRFYGAGATGTDGFPVVQAFTNKHDPLIPVADPAWIRMMALARPTRDATQVVLHGVLDETWSGA